MLHTRYEDMDRKIEALKLRFPAKAVRLLFFVVVFSIRFPAGLKTSAFRLADITLLAVNTSHNQHPSFKCVHFLNVFNLRSAPTIQRQEHLPPECLSLTDLRYS